jgi:hypothetical protein
MRIEACLACHAFDHLSLRHRGEMPTASLSSQVNHELWWIDLIVTAGFCAFVTHGWSESKMKYPDTGDEEFRLRIADGLRAAASAGLTVVAILLPTSVIGVQLSLATSDKLLVGHTAAANLFIASWWLLASIISGLYVVFVAATRGIHENLHHRLDVGCMYALELCALVIACIRLVLAIASVTGRIVQL